VGRMSCQFRGTRHKAERRKKYEMCLWDSRVRPCLGRGLVILARGPRVAAHGAHAAAHVVQQRAARVVTVGGRQCAVYVVSSRWGIHQHVPSSRPKTWLLTSAVPRASRRKTATRLIVFGREQGARVTWIESQRAYRVFPGRAFRLRLGCSTQCARSPHPHLNNGSRAPDSSQQVPERRDTATRSVVVVGRERAKRRGGIDSRAGG
jgi:hypothetical protein